MRRSVPSRFTSFHPLRCLERFIPIEVAFDYVLRDTWPPAYYDGLKVFHGNRVWNSVEIVCGATLEEVPDDLDLGGLKEIADISPRIAFGPACKLCEVNVVLKLQILSIDLEHVHARLDVRQRDVDSLLEPSYERLVKDPRLVCGADEVNMEFLVLVEDSVHLFEELVSDPNLPTDLFSPDPH